MLTEAKFLKGLSSPNPAPPSPLDAAEKLEVFTEDGSKSRDAPLFVVVDDGCSCYCCCLFS